MRFFAVIPALLAVAFAAPKSASAPITRAPATSDLRTQAQSLIDEKTAAGCSLLDCLAALAPAAVSCASALAEDGLNPLTDAACFAAALNDVANPPAACDACA